MNDQPYAEPVLFPEVLDPHTDVMPFLALEPEECLPPWSL